MQRAQRSSSNSRPSQAVCGLSSAIDYSAYPHIVERIIASASPQALYVLRSTSRALKHRADAALFHHVILGPDGITAPGHRLPALGRISRAALRHARVVDYVDDVNTPVDTPAPDRARLDDLHALSNVRVARRTFQSRSVLPVPTVVDFVHLSPCRSTTRHHPSVYDGSSARWAWPTGTKRILSLKYAEEALISRRHLQWSATGDMVIILSRNEHAAPPTATHLTLSAWGDRSRGVLTPLVAEIAAHPGCTFTLVGVLEMPEAVLGMPEEGAAERLVQAIADASDADLEFVGDRIRFQSLDEYGKAVGEAAFELHTTCPETRQGCAM